jgi:conjugal transfer pilus assembly protein TraE
MDYQNYKSDLERSLAENVFLKRLSIGCTVVAGILALCVLFTDTEVQTIIVTPELTTEFSVKGDTVSEQWLMMMADRLVNLNLSVTPANVDRNNTMFLSYVHPMYYGYLKKEFDLQAERIRKEQISTFFYPVEFKFKLKAKRVAVTGDLHTLIGGRYVGSSRNTYEIAFGKVDPPETISTDVKQEGNYRIGSQAVTEFFLTESNNVFKTADNADSGR